MNRLYRTGARRRTTSGQAVYQAMLAITCVALAVAVVFPLIHYFTRHRGQSVAGARYSSSRPPARSVEPAREPAPKPEAEAEPEGKKEGEAAPAGESEAPKPAAETADTTAAPAGE